MNIGIALALNYKKEDITPFLKSYEKYASGELLLVTNTPNEFETNTKIKTVNIFDLAKQYNINLQALTVFNLKPIIFYILLKEYKNKNFKNVVLSDVDLFFQYDPFLLITQTHTKNFLICEEKKTYKECDTNTTWFNAGYSEIYKDVENKKILNCGFTVGSIESVLEYQKQVAYELQKILATRPYFAYDQVILNVLTHSTKTLQPTILEHGNPYIVHMHHMDPSELTPNIFTEEFLLNKQGTPYCVVHQYNEKEQGNKFVQRVWSL